MKKGVRLGLFVIWAAADLGMSLTIPAARADSFQTPAPGMPKIPLYFIANRGQEDGRALFYAYLGRTTLWLTREGLIFDSLKPGDGTPRAREVTRLIFKGLSPKCEIMAFNPADYTVSYFNGSGPADWITGLPTSSAVLYKEIYDRIDLKIYSAEQEVEYDWIVKPGGDPGRIRMVFEGADKTIIDGEGNLVIETSRGAVKHRRPSAYQEDSGRRIRVEAGFSEIARNEFGIKVGPHDRSRDLFIDPYTIGYSTYFGGKDYDYTTAIAAAPSGEVFLTGQTFSPDFPVATGSSKSSYIARCDAFVLKMAQDGQSLAYSAFFPLVSGSPLDLAVDESGAATIVGYTSNNKFPIKNAFQEKFGGGDYDGFITKLAPNGRSLVFSSYFGGSDYDYISAIGLDPNGSPVISGSTASKNLRLYHPIQGRLAGMDDVFITKFSPDGRTLVYSTYFGGSNYDRPERIAVDRAGAAYIVGTTFSMNFPVKNALQKLFGGMYDVFVAKLAPDGRRLVYSTYLGGSSYDSASGIAVEDSGAVVISGFTNGRFPLYKAFRTVRKGIDGFVTKFAPDGQSLVYSTYLGGSGHDFLYCVAVDGKGQVCLGGETTSADFPLKNAVQKKKNGTMDSFLSLLSMDGQSLIFSTFLGGSYYDAARALFITPDSKIYVAGLTNSPDFPTVGAFQKMLKGNYDSYLVRFDSKK